jgi:hypothetical protein
MSETDQPHSATIAPENREAANIGDAALKKIVGTSLDKQRPSVRPILAAA